MQRQVRGVLEVDGEPGVYTLEARRYECQRCGAVITVVPAGMLLKLAGAEKNLFAQDAVALMHEHATGALRDVDRVAHGAMRDAARRKRKIVDRDAVERVLAGRLPIA
jgi:type II secretory pathway predicted ATPase ExeA